MDKLAPWPEFVLRWCPACNVPLLDRECGNCGSLGFKVRTTPPSDVRPAFQYDVNLISEAIRSELGEEALMILMPEGCMVLLNKVAYVDAADEVIVGGQVIGHRYFDPVSMRWRFKPLYKGVDLLLDNEAGPFAVVDRLTLKRLYTVHRQHVIKANYPSKGSYIALGTKDGRHRAVGKLIEGRRILVLKVWKRTPSPFLTGSSDMGRALSCNKDRVEALAERSAKLLERISRDYRNLPLVASFSGGKDSLASLLLALDCVGEIPILFNDTGLELPETVRHAAEVGSRYSSAYLEAGAGDVFFRAAERLGPPARDYRWCCKTCKLIPISRIIRKEFPGGALCIVGQRAYESFSRARRPIVWRSVWIKGVVAATPIQIWTSLDVWLYLNMKREEGNPLYKMGFDRIGCWLCPACELAEFAEVRKLHPELWGQWYGFLCGWAESKGLPEAWIRYGLWRWRRLPGDQRRLVDKLRVNEAHVRRSMLGFNIVREEAMNGGIKVVALPSMSLPLGRVKNLASTICRASIENGVLRMESADGRMSAVMSCGGELCVVAKDSRSLEDLLKAMCRAASCISCSSCVDACARGAIAMEPYGIRIREDLCVKCGECNRSCPIAEYYVSDLELRGEARGKARCQN